MNMPQISDQKHSETCTPRRTVSRILHSLWIIAVIILIMLANTGESPGSSSHPPNIMTSDEIRPGMRGYGLSVFKGTRVESFPVVVMGRIKNALGESDMILVEVVGGYPVTHRTGIVAGMSGSPIYINGRLIGAIGYGWGFSKEAIAGVTPIEHMMRDLHREGGTLSRDHVKHQPVRAVLENPVEVGGERYFDAVVHRDFANIEKDVPAGTMVMSPVPTLLHVQGFNPRTMDAIREELKPFGLKPVAVPGGSNVPMSRGYRVEPGSAIGVTLVDGDLFIGGTGTVTYRRGDAILAFGHPMMQLGSTNIPLNAAYIEGIMPSMMRPFKFASSMGIVGTMTQDRAFAISGQLGQKPSTYPMKVQVHDVERNTRRRFNLNVSRMGYLNPVLMYVVILDATNSSYSDVKWTTIKGKLEIRIKGYEPIRFEEYVSGRDASSQFPRLILSLFRFLDGNEFGDLEIEGIDLNVEMYPDRQVARILDLSTRNPHVRPGDRLEVTATLEDPEGKVFTRSVRIPVPADAQKGVVRIAASGADEMRDVYKQLQIKPVPPSNIHQVVDYIRKMERGNDLTFMASFPTRTVVYSGIRINDLPGTIQGMLLSSPRGSVENSLNSFRELVSLPYFVQGSHVITVQISHQIPSAQDAYAQEETSVEPTIPQPSSPSPEPDKVNSRLSALTGAFPIKIQPVPMSESKTPKKSESDKTAGTYMAALADSRDYFMGNFHGTSIIDGNIILGRVKEEIYTTHQAFVMAMVRDSSTGIIHLVEAPGGDVVKIDAQGKSSVVGNLREVLSPAMTASPDGNIYIGTGPNGRIFQVDPAGNLKLFATLPRDIIWDLLVEPGGTLLAACGNRGAVYRVDSAGRAKVVFEPSEAHVTALTFGDNGSFFAGCSNEGSIYKIEPTGEVTSFYRTGGSSINSLLYIEGNLWIASEELVYKVGGEDQHRVFFFPEQSVIRLAPGNDGSILVGTSAMGRVYRINADESIENLYEANINQVTAMDQDPDTGVIYAATGNPGGVIQIHPHYPDAGYYLSRVIDTGSFSEFGNLTWTVAVEEGTDIAMQTRSGNTISPDSTWSPWSLEYNHPEGQRIMSPPGRYVQVRAILRSSNPENTPWLYETALYYRHVSQSALMEFEAPDGAQRWSGSQDVKWKVFVSNPSVMAFDLYHSYDAGDSWEPVKRGILPALEDLQKSAREKSQKPMVMSYKWDTRKVDDDWYLLKVEGYDRTDPENRYLISQVVSKPVMICNTSPEATLTGEELRGELLVVEGFAKSSLVNVKEVHYRIGQGKWNIAFAKDGIFDDTREKFHVYLNPPYPNRFKIEVKVFDEAGNTGTDSKWISVKSVEQTRESDPENNGSDGDGNGDDNDNDNGDDEDQDRSDVRETTPADDDDEIMETD